MNIEDTKLIEYCNKVAFLVQKEIGENYIVRAGKIAGNNIVVAENNIARLGIGIEEKDAGEASPAVFIYLDGAYNDDMPPKEAAKYAIMAYHSENVKKDCSEKTTRRVNMSSFEYKGKAIYEIQNTEGKCNTHLYIERQNAAYHCIAYNADDKHVIGHRSFMELLFTMDDAADKALGLMGIPHTNVKRIRRWAEAIDTAKKTGYKDSAVKSIS